MSQWLLFFFAVLAAAAGGVLAEKCKIPLGAMTGSLTVMILCVLAFGDIPFPPWGATALQVLSGTLVGCKITKENLIGCLKRLHIVLFLVFGMLIFNAISGVILAKTGGLDLLTALFACAPGGLSDMVIAAGELGADVTYVSLVQVSRVVIITCVFPAIYRLIHDRKLYPGGKKPAATVQALPIQAQAGGEKWLLWVAVTFSVALAGSVVVQSLSIIAGGILGAAAAVTTLNLTTRKAQFPPCMNRVLQIAIGIYVGSEVTRDILFSMTSLIFPILLVILIMLLSSYLMALVICRFTSLDFMSCLLMCTPGGMQEMALLASELQCDMASVVVTQTMRVVLVLLLFPNFLSFFVELFGRFV